MIQPSKHTYHAIGLMSGSSLDGLDIAYCRFEFRENKDWDFKFIFHASAELGLWKEKLKEAVQLPKIDLDKLSQEFAEYLAQEVQRFEKKYKISEIDLIASHGHTIFHYPNKGVTCQIGDGQVLANLTGYTVISNLRQRDMDFGGQGAPIVPIGDKYLFSSYPYCLNIGGIANISVKQGEKILAYDIAVANQVLNQLAVRLGHDYDKDGLWARRGNCNDLLLRALNQLDYYQLSPPKSLDNAYTQEVMKLIDEFALDVKDSLATYTEHIALQIAKNIKQFDIGRQERSVLITGGGAHNTFLIERIEALSNCEIEIPPPDIIDYKEAIIMGFIGVLRLRNEVNVLSSVTGARQDTSSGEVFLPK